MKAAGLFFSHLRTDRVERHYDRLVEETQGLVEWHFAYNPENKPAPRLDVAYQPAEQCMPRRCRRAVENGGILGGYTDTAMLPCMLALDSDFVWVVEYDVDFSGCWRELFAQFAANDADLLTTTLVPLEESQQWYWWHSARVPPNVTADCIFRAFHPIFRMSRRLAHIYREATENAEWDGHYEFLIPTVAATAGLRIEDIGGSRPDRPETWASSNYVNQPSDPHLTPGTFRWRPPQPRYFHEAPGDFGLSAKLYHPVKPETADKG